MLQVYHPAHSITQSNLSLWQAYVNEFKFQSITADDALEFYLKYFPELKKKGVETIPGQQYYLFLDVAHLFGTYNATYGNYALPLAGGCLPFYRTKASFFNILSKIC